jgi:hypothetical protein
VTDDCFFERDSKVLTAGAFAFVLESEIKRADRYQNYLTLVTVEASREWEGMTVTADDGTLEEVAGVIRREIRDTDMVGHTEKGILGLMLLDADFDQSARGHRTPALADSGLRVSERAADRHRRRLLSHSRHRRRVADASGAFETAGELARRLETVFRSELRSPAMTHTAISSLVIAAVVSTSAFAPQRASAGPLPPAMTEPDKKPVTQAPPASDEFRIGSGDKLRVEVYKDQQLSQSVQVRPDGKITLPLIGDIEATGRTPIELSRRHPRRVQGIHHQPDDHGHRRRSGRRDGVRHG